jgi:2-polyprenyl-6-methoxyphenol hydroxylase-like FAD-dependent oxidoreductase
MRHPLTSGGTTVALNDVLILRSLLGALPDFKDRAQINRVVRQWHWRRKLVSSTVNILSAALYDVLTGQGAFSIPAIKNSVRLTAFRFSQTRTLPFCGQDT